MSMKQSSDRSYGTSTRQKNLRINVSRSNWNARERRVYRPFPPNAFVQARDGEVLGKGMILKHDHFKTGLSDKCEVHFCGAPNFRLILHGNLGAVGQATVPGMRAIFNFLNTGSSIVEQQLASSSAYKQLFLATSPANLRSSLKKLPLQSMSQSARRLPSKSKLARAPSGKNLHSLSVRHSQVKQRDPQNQCNLL
jgi:hypothetical protein